MINESRPAARRGRKSMNLAAILLAVTLAFTPAMPAVTARAAVSKQMSYTVAQRSIDTLAVDVMLRKYGKGTARRAALGSKYTAVQARVNQFCKNRTLLLDKMVEYVLAGYAGTEATRQVALGSYYDEVQALINKKFGVTPAAAPAKTETKTETKAETKTETASSPAVSASVSVKGKAIAEYAASWYKTFYYKYGGNSTKQAKGYGMDCVSYVQMVLKHFGISFSRTMGKEVKSLSAALPGDIIFLRTSKTDTVWHPAVYVGNNQYLICSNSVPYRSGNAKDGTTGGVKYASLTSSNMWRIRTIRRVAD